MQPLAPAGAGMAEATMVGEDARSTSTSISESHHDAPPHMLHRSSSTRLSLRAANIRHRLRAMGSTAGSQAATVPSVGLDRSVAGVSGVGLSVSVAAESGPTPLATATHTAEDRKTFSKRLDSLSETVANPPPAPPSLNATSEAVAAAPVPSVTSRPPLLKAASRAPSTNLDASTPFFDLVGNVMVGADVTGPSGAKPGLLPLEEAAGEGSTSVTQLLCRDLPRKYFANYPMQCANLALIVLSFVLYVIETYIPLQRGFNMTGTIGAYTAFMLLLEYGLSVMFTFDFLCTLVLAPSATAYLLSYWGVVEVFSILPGYLTAAGITYMSFFRILRLMKVVRIMRLHHLRGTAGAGSSSDEQEDATDVELASIVRTISLAILLMTGIVYAAATASPTPLYSKAVLQFHDALYYVVVTIATVGYGDIYPTEPFSRMLAVVIIVLAFTIIPYAIGQLIDTLRRRESEKYYRTVRLKTGQPHVVICGHLTHKGLHRFVQELFHPNYRHLHPDMAAVVLSPDPPRGRMRSLLTHSRYSARMHYVAGSPHFSLDLQRARVSTAKAIFILSQVMVNESNSPQEDRLLLYDMAIRQHIHHQRAKDSLLGPSPPAQGLLQSRPPQVLLQVNTTAAKEKVMMENDKALTPPRPRPPASSGSAATTGHSPGWSTNSSPKNRSDTPTQDEDAVINPVSLVSQAPSQRCISTLEFKMAVMAYGLVFRGFIGLFLNTLRSTPSSLRSMTSAQSWLHGYRAGATYNVYSVRLNTERHETVVGKTFLGVATSLYAASRLVAVAVKDDRHVRLNPGPDFIFRAKMVCVIFVLAQSYAQIESALEQLDTTCMEQQQPAPASSSSPTTVPHSHHPHQQRHHRQWFGSGRRDYGVYSKLALGVPTTSACPRSAPLPTSHPTPVVSSGVPSSTGSVKRQSASAEEVHGLLTEASRCADQIKTQPYEDRIKLLGLADKGRQCLEKIIEAQALLQHDSDALKGLSGHIVVCLCSSAASPPASYAWLEHLLVPLRRLINSQVVVLGHTRAAFLDLLHGLHAVSATERDASTGASRLELGDIFFYQGSAHSRADLQAVKVTEAIRVVLLSSSGSGADTSGGSSSSQVPEDAEGFALGDRDVLLAMSTLEGLLPNDLYDKVFTVTDIIHDGNSKHLRQEGSNSLAAAASQTNMQHQLTWDQTLNLMRGGGAPGVSALLQQSEHALLLQPAGGAVREDLYDWPLIASGRVCPQGGLDVLLVRMFYNPLEMEFWKNLLNIHHAKKSLVSSRLHPSCLQGYLDQVSVPSDLRGRRYEEAVQDLMADGVVVLGLYRPMGCLGAPMAYVHVAPPPSTVLDPSDKLFVVMPPRLADENDNAPGAAEAALSRLVFKTPPRPGKADDKDATGLTPMPSLHKPSPAKASGGAGKPTELAMTPPPRPLPSLSGGVGNKKGERGIQQSANEERKPSVTAECKGAKTGGEPRPEGPPGREEAREQKADGSHALTTAGTDTNGSVQNVVAAAGVEEKGLLSHSNSSVAPEAGSLEDSSAPSSAASTVTTTTNSSEGSQA